MMRPRPSSSPFAAATRRDLLDPTDLPNLARLGHVSRARVTQIMNLLHLAPDIQEEILFLPRVMSGRDPIRESHIRPIATEVDWDRQRRMSQEMLASRKPM